MRNPKQKMATPGTGASSIPPKEDLIRRRLPHSATPKPGALGTASRGPIKDLNKFNQHETLSHGYLNASLLSANASQLQMVIQSGFPGPMFYVQLGLLLVSIVLQVTQGILLLRKYQINLETANDNDESDDEKDSQRAHKYNNWAMVVSIMIIAVNIIISTFGASLFTASKAKTA
ncbi:ninjurin-A-like [Branchiostoma lanceolatum]|uniref:ninjurin-A-like n=1 Tax=Branchiostoma lanceolatum TaxID=7740 RepID=UPI003452B1F4